jgi:hypothetical protein
MVAMTRSPYRTYVVAMVVAFVVTAAVLVVVMAARQHTCLIETQADPLGGLPASRIPAQCAAQFHTHVQGSLIVSGIVALLVAPAVAVWRMVPPRRRRQEQQPVELH